MNAVYRWGLTVAQAVSLSAFGRPSPMSGDHRDTWILSRMPPAVQEENNA